MKSQDPSRHSIADIRNWRSLSNLELQPDYQRRSVWAMQAKIMLIDSILEKIPLPKIYISSIIKKGSTHRVVIDGQQRISAILGYLDNEFPLLSPYKGLYHGKYFEDLPEKIQHNILSYMIDFNEFKNYSDEQIRKVYNRVNKYTVTLNKQELRRADFPGDFLEVSQELSVEDFLDEFKIFTPVNRRRMADVEYVSELLVILIDGVQDKKTYIDKYYIEYEEWDINDLNNVRKRFLAILSDINKIFNVSGFPISKTRFKQKSDFYSLFAAINELHKRDSKLIENNIKYLIEELEFLDNFIEPEAQGVFGEYAIKCVSDANSRNSRFWRMDFLMNYFAGAYTKDFDINKRIEFIINLFPDASIYCGPATFACPTCKEEITEGENNSVFCFPKGTVFPHTKELIHIKCLEKNKNNWTKSNA